MKITIIGPVFTCTGVNVGIEYALKNAADYYVIFTHIACIGKSPAAHLLFLNSERFLAL